MTDFETKAVLDRVQELLNKQGDGLVEKFDKIDSEIHSIKAKGGRMGSGVYESKGLRNVIQNGIHRALFEKKELIGECQLTTPYEIKTVANIASSNLTVDNFISYLDWQSGTEATGQF